MVIYVCIILSIFSLFESAGAVEQGRANTTANHNCRHIFHKNLMNPLWRKAVNETLLSKIGEAHKRLDQVISDKKLTIWEGHSASYSDELRMYIQVSQNPCIKTICEIGFNAGHSALLWLHANPHAKVVFFDLYAFDYSSVGEAFIREQTYLNPSRLTIHKGDSTKIVREVHASEPSLVCDLISVDGGHTHEIAVADLHNMYYLANPLFNILVVDDTNCNEKWCVDSAIRVAMSNNIVKFYEGLSEKSARGVSVGTYLRNS